MCSVTWLHRAGGYDLFFNRDEKRARRCARPPAVGQVGGIHCIYPVDPEAGGTWMGVNEFGLTLCILNHHPPFAAEDVPRCTSRGQLLLSSLEAPTASAAVEGIVSKDLAAFRPFILLAVERNVPARCLTWDGRKAQQTSRVAPDLFLTTSSFDTGRVMESRKGWFEKSRLGAGAWDVRALLDFHKSHHPEAGPYSVCMHRQDARTVSFSHIHVTSSSAAFHYADGPPCRARLEPTVELQLGREGGAAGSGI